MTINIKIPRSWNELSEKQLKEIAYIMEIYRNLPDTKDLALLTRLYYQVIKNCLRGNNFLKIWYALRQIPVQQYKEHVQFLYDENNRTKFLPSFKIHGVRYHPPLARLQNVSIKEFSFLDSMYYHWRMTKKDSYLDLLCAALYRRQGKPNTLDVRQPFDKIIVEKELAVFQKLDPKKKLAIAYAYEGSRNYIVKLYPTIFPKSKSNQDGKSGKYTPFGQLLIHKIGFDPSKLIQTQNLNAHEFLSIHENELKEIKKNATKANA